MDYPTYMTPEAEALPSGTYLALFHGRDDAKQNMDDLGYAGPVIGPVRFVHTTYADEMQVCLAGQSDASITIPVVEDCASFGDKYYGEWTVYQHEQRRQKDMPVKADRRKVWA